MTLFANILQSAGPRMVRLGLCRTYAKTLREIKAESRRIHTIGRAEQPTFMRTILDNRTRRRTAVAMLLVWLFALASGMVNACVLENSGSHGHAPVDGGVSTAPAMQAAAITAGHLGVVASHDENSTPSKPSCLKACDDDSRSLSSKVPSGLDLTDPGLAPFAAIVWVAAASVGAQTRRDLDARPPPFGPPARLRFSRLAL